MLIVGPQGRGPNQITWQNEGVTPRAGSKNSNGNSTDSRHVWGGAVVEGPEELARGAAKTN